MQDSSLYSQIKTQIQHPHPQFPEQEHLKCPRCDSTNTKFCYYNNYNLSQPRHFCKNCRRYWTKGGALRNIPVGGGSRKNSKRSSSSSSSSSSTATSSAAKRPAAAVSECHNESKNVSDSDMAEALSLKGDNFGGQFGNFMEMSGSFSSLLGSSGTQFGGLLDGLGPNEPSLQIGGDFGDLGPGSGQNVGREMGLESGNSNNGDGFLNIEGRGESGSWDGSSNEWPDLAIYTPGPNFQ